MKPDNAEKIIRDYWGDGNVKDFATAITDVIIESPEKGISFAAKVMPMTASEEQVNSYKGKLSASMQLRGAPKLPVAIIKVDEDRRLQETKEIDMAPEETFPDGRSL